MLQTESDRGCALIAANLLENTLEMTINCHIADGGKKFRDSFFVSSGAPLSTFAAKIKMGFALAIYDDEVLKAFGIVKDVRNAFAHALRPLDFEHPTIVASCKKLHSKPLPGRHEDQSSARIRYSAYCYGMGKKLYEVAEEKGGGKLTISISNSDWIHQTERM